LPLSQGTREGKEGELEEKAGKIEGKKSAFPPLYSHSVVRERMLPLLACMEEGK